MAQTPSLVSENGQWTPNKSVPELPIQGEPKNQPPFVQPPSGPGLTTVRSADQLGNVATSEVNADIAGQTAPLEAQAGMLTTQEDRTRQGLTDMFGTIMPYVAGAAANVKGAYDEAEQRQQGIFSAATQRLNELKQSRAQEAQALAQEMGGPVALSEFTAGMDQNMESLANLGSGQMLHTLGYAQAGVQEANAFSGRVFPLVQTEEQAKARNYFEDQKTKIQDQIASLKAQAPGLIDKRKNELLVQERSYALQKTQQALDKIKASHDWLATKRTLKNDDARLRMAQDQFKLQEAGVTGTIDGKPTLQARALTVSEKRQAQAFGLSQQEFQQRKAQFNKSYKLSQAQVATAKNQTYSQWLDAAVNPQPGKTVTTSQVVPVDPTTAFRDKSAFVTSWKKDSKGNRIPATYGKIVKTSQTPINAPITNPGAIVDYLTAHNVPKKIAVKMVKARLRLPSDWVYGEGDPNAATGNQGRNMPGGANQRPG